MSFDDWYNSAEFGGLAIFQMVDQGIAEFIYKAGRAEQREADAVWLESKNYELLGTDLAKALRKQEIE